MTIEYDDYERPEKEAEEVDISADLNLDDKVEFEEEGFSEVAILEQLAKKSKAATGSRFSLKARRAIEDHLEQRKLQKENDYLFDDDFADEDESGKKE